MSDIKTHLHKWQATMQSMETQERALRALTGAEPESPLICAISDMQSAYTDAVSDAIGCSRDWLANWWLEYEFGKRPMRVKLKKGGWHKVKTMDDLAEVIVRYMRGDA
jgi:hypothetical protein